METIYPTLLSSCVPHSGLKTWKEWLPWVLLENWKRLEKVGLLSDVGEDGVLKVDAVGGGML